MPAETQVDALLAEGRALRSRLRELAEAALAYDAAIQRAAIWQKPWVGGDALDVRYERWVTLAREALGSEHDG